MFGLHWAFVPIFVNNVITAGSDSLMGLLAANQFAIAGAALAFGLRAIDKQQKSLAISTGGTTLLGVSEPALYGVLLPNKKPLIMAIIGGSVGGLFGGLMHSKVYTFVPAGVFAIPGAINPEGIDLGFYGYVIQMAVGLIVAFVLTYFWGYQKSGNNKSGAETALVTSGPANGSVQNSQVATNKAEQITVYSPLSGETVELKDVSDEAFSSGAMGKGIAIIPSNGKLVSPVTGVVTTVTKSKHAIAITGDLGEEVLIHVGLDTVKLKGEGFDLKVTEGDRLQVGDILMEVDLNLIKDRGFDVVTPVIITNTFDYSEVESRNLNRVIAGESLLTLVR